MMNRSNALGLVRRDIPCCPDRARDVLTELARRHGLRLAFTVELVAGPLVSNLVVAQHIAEHDAAAVIVPSFGHADGVRQVIIGAAALITPIRVYPSGYQWSRLEAGGRAVTACDCVLVILVVSLLAVTGAALLWPVRGSSGSAGAGRAENHEGESRSADES